MKNLKAEEIRKLYLDFFKEKDHDVEPSAPLVPFEDPSLLWINSGVATLKKYFDGRVIPENPRIVNAQKSIRTNDIENVGKTARHHTFFEMLGNFSIGEYFKKEAIHWAWEFLTDDKWIGFDADKLSVTIHPEDEEAYAIWLNEVGVPAERIIRLEGNFWDIGEGPSGPNSEIFYDRGESYGNDPEDPELYPGGENERYLEIWNLVFSQFNHNADHTYTPLPKQNIDTGMGLERMASVVQDVPTNYDTDLFVPIIEKTAEISGKSYGESQEQDMAFKVIADHVRTVAFAIGDGALPSNEGRGYVLRRLLRRAVRYSKKLGIEKPFMYQLVPVVGEIMQSFYPEVKDKEDFIVRVMKLEEERFLETLHDGLEILSTVAEKQKQAGHSEIPGEDVFRLYDTYGFPVELTEEYAEDVEMTVDHAGFERAMNEQRERARNARQNVNSMQTQSEVLGNIKEESEFIGYSHTVADAEIVAIVKDGELVDSAQEGEEVQLVLDRTPFYAESGGQIADKGTLSNDLVSASVLDVKKAPNGQNLHNVRVDSGELTKTAVKAKVDASERRHTIKNHTATHLLHQALKDVLGTHVNQAGSYVGPDRLRFDFSHFGQVTKEELATIEQAVNEKIWEGIEVESGYHNLQEAKDMGAMALFGEKYGDVVRVVAINDYSLELCGGIHVANTSEIGVFKIVSEGGIGAGVRRIEALTGKGAYVNMKQSEKTLDEAASLLKANPRDLVQKVESTQADIKSLQRENESLLQKIANAQSGELLESARKVGDVTVLSAKVQAKDNNQLRQMVDDLKAKFEQAVIVLGASDGDKVMLAAGVSKNIAGKDYHAGNIVKAVAEQCGGKGGGRPDMAMAGAKNPEQLDAALESVYTLVK
ncbi:MULTISPECIES: alanine--tRNA ligase [unclassified Planococcus (in: firmicutes)]|uniref:alanine--tRNA ligase n=1 Tax=Planococcus TaxID=1372 RepID=UPI000C33B947|nr:MULTISPECIES: alanine--tRNA ligase [unclassified Planococcus (in: firmicutes)]AUD13710.1 alanine--tRNA ligase [Planococcus sp. MB-3u-03]PKG45817.1 alanine--tRNA ligase [Planococcus sp. Urea-trap-24]PKG88474.1 alanine--tRNA ligase [Planococcus sp. Urea-3u-39]PKH38808.1 alanine--tRNA ligase [Planococcus sp. MB-3u-09]